MLSKKELDRLIAHDSAPAVTLLMPSHMGSREQRQDPVRLRKLAQSAVDRLAASGMRRTEAEHFLEPARALAAFDPFWQEQSPGLAIFLAHHVFEVMRLPFSTREELVIGSRFHVRHLLPALEGDKPFYLLTLSSRRARLLRASRYEVMEVRDETFPAEWDEAPDEWSDPRIYLAELRRLKDHAQPDAKPGNIGKFFSFLSHVAHGARRATNAGDVPVVLVAIEELQGHFRRLANLSNLLPACIETNPEILSDTALAEAGHSLIRPRLAARHSAARERFEMVFGQGRPAASIDIAEVLEAARNGRVDTLFVADDTHLWGTLDGAADGGQQHDEQAAGDEDLLDVAAAETWRNGGVVEVLPRAQAPFGKPVAALFRY
jgi:hypothetical protein